METFVEDGDIVVPGQLLAKGDYKIINGVRKSDNEYFATILGLYSVNKDKLLVKELAGRYLPNAGDFIIGYITDAKITSWEVDIRAPYSGILLASNAIKGRFDPIKDDTRRIYEIGDVIKAEILSFDRTREPHLTTKNHGLGKLNGGIIIEISPKKIPRLIGKKGSMISMIKKYTNSNILIGQNGRVWIQANTADNEFKAIEAIKQVSREAHVSGLTDRIKELLTN